MIAADKIEAARALIEPLRATVLWQNANPNVMKAADLLAALADLAAAQAQQVTEWREEYRAVQGMNDLLRAANGKLIAEKDAQVQDGWLYHCPDSGLEWSEDHPHESGQCTDATDVRPATVENLKAQLLDSWEAWAEDRERADAQAQENAKLRGLLWHASHEFNAIRARDGAPRASCSGCLGPALVSEEWWNTLTEAFGEAIGKEARTPWPSPEAKAVSAALRASRPEDDTAAQEEIVCTCGAWHGSLEGHTDWCDYAAIGETP